MARPCALSGLAGTARLQFPDAAASAAVWFRFIALPAPSTGAVATSPSWRKAVCPLAKLAAGATAAAAAAAVVVGVAAAAALAGALWAADAQGAAVAAAAAALALADGDAHDPRADWAIFVVLPLEIARMIPSVRPNAIGMARGTAIRAARLLLLRRRHADRCPLSIQSTSMDVRLCRSRCITVDPGHCPD